MSHSLIGRVLPGPSRLRFFRKLGWWANLVVETERLQASYGDMIAYRLFRQTVFQCTDPCLARQLLGSNATAFQRKHVQRLAPWLGPLDSAPATSVAMRELPEFHESELYNFASNVVERVWLRLTADGVRVCNLSELLRNVCHSALVEAVFGKFPASQQTCFETWKHWTGLVPDRTQNVSVHPIKLSSAEFKSFLPALLTSRSWFARLAESQSPPWNDPRHYSLAWEVAWATIRWAGAYISKLIVASIIQSEKSSLATRAAITADRVNGTGPLRGEVISGVGPTAVVCENLIQEACRKFPLVGLILRQAEGESDWGGFRVPRGALCLVPVWVLHADPRWFPDSLTFQSDRFPGCLTNSQARQAFFPFGCGPETNVFAQLVMMGGTRVLRTILGEFEFRALDGVVKPETDPRRLWEQAPEPFFQYRRRRRGTRKI